MELFGYDSDNFPDDLKTFLIREACRHFARGVYLLGKSGAQVGWKYRRPLLVGGAALALHGAVPIWAQKEGAEFAPGSFAGVASTDVPANLSPFSSITLTTGSATTTYTSIGPINR